MAQQFSEAHNKRAMRYIIFGVLAFGLLLGLKALLMTKERVEMMTSGVRVTGEVIRVDEVKGRNSRREHVTSYFPIIHYKVAATGEDVVIRADTSDFDHKVGHKLEMIYQPDSPNQGMVVDFVQLWAKNIALWVVSFLVTLTGAIGWFFERKWAKAPTIDPAVLNLP